MNNKGFTLAELLIVVAIIAILIAIGMPFFSKQLEKSREATDISNVRSAYAKVMTEAVCDSRRSSGDVTYNAGRYYTTVNLKQKKNGWQSPQPITIGEVSSSDYLHWTGIPAAAGSCTVSYSITNGVVFAWNYDFLPIFGMKQNGNSSYKDDTVANLLLDKDFTRLESSGTTGRHYINDIKHQLGLSNSDQFSYLITKGDSKGEYNIYFSTSYTLKTSTKTTGSITITGYKYNINTNSIIKQGSPQTVSTYINSSNQEKITETEYKWDE